MDGKSTQENFERMLMLHTMEEGGKEGDWANTNL